MRLLLRFFFCAFVTFNMHKVFAQDSSSRVALFVSPALLQPASLAMQGGLRFQTGEKGSLLVEAAVPVLRINRSYQKVNARRTSVEWRLQPETSSPSGHYFALQASYLFRNISDTNSGKLYQRYGEYQYRAALIKANVLALAVKFGREISAPSEQKIVDVFIGIGGRHLFTRYTAVDLPPATAGGAIDNYGWIFPGEGWRYNEPFLRIYFTVGFRIGWKL